MAPGGAPSTTLRAEGVEKRVVLLSKARLSVRLAGYLKLWARQLALDTSSLL